MNDKRRKYFKAIFGLLFAIYIVAVFYIFKKPCAIYSIEYCSLNGSFGLAYLTIWSIMITGGLYSLYLAIASLKHGVYSSEKILLLYSTKPVTGKRMYIYCFIFFMSSFVVFMFVFFWWGSLADTVAEYNYLYPDKNIKLIN